MIKNIRSYLNYAPKKMIAAVIMITSAIVVPTVAFAWGPSRDTFTTAKPADYVTFNSIVDNPVQGDERNFMQVKASDTANSTYADSISLVPGKKYTVSMYYHNNAASNLNLTANGAYAKVQIPAVVTKGSANIKAVGKIGASNAKPTEVWDDISFNNSTDGDIALRFVPGSAHIYNRGKTNGAELLGDKIITSGIPLGYDNLDGNLKGSSDYAGYITFEVTADQPNFTISQQVRIKGTTNWSESVNTKTGDQLEFQIEYKNTGTTQQNDVVIKDVLPAELSYVKGSTLLKNASNPNPKNVSDNLVSNTGINIGNYTAGSNAFLKYEAIVTSDVKCGTNTITNKVDALTNNGSKSDTASFVTNKTCDNNDGGNTDDTTKKVDEVKTLEKPAELPRTGPADMLIGTLGIGSMVTSAAYYVASRKNI